MGREYKIASKQDKRPLVDTETFSLAEHFLSDQPDATEDNKWELAKVIQDAIEGWFEHGAPISAEEWVDKQLACINWPCSLGKGHAGPCSSSKPGAEHG